MASQKSTPIFFDLSTEPDGQKQGHNVILLWVESLVIGGNSAYKDVVRCVCKRLCLSFG